MGTIGNSKLVSSMFPNFNNKRFILKSIFFSTACFLLIIALVNPQRGSENEKVKANGADVFILLDISTSMLAQDVAPSRLERSKKFASDLIDRLKGNRIALIYFAGNAFLQMPLSLDQSAAEMLIRSANPNQVGTQGTNLNDALELAEKAAQSDQKTQRVAIIISDLESHGDDVIDQITTMNQNSWIIDAAGVGTSEGSYIPVDEDGQQGYKRDQDGELITSKLNNEMLQKIAYAGGGISVLVNVDSSIIKLADQISKVKAGEISTYIFANYKPYFQYFLGVSLCMFMLSFFLDNRKPDIK